MFWLLEFEVLVFPGSRFWSLRFEVLEFEVRGFEVCGLVFWVMGFGCGFEVPSFDV